MVDTLKLKATWVAKGLKQEDVAKNILNVTPKTLGIKLKKGIFGSDEIEKMVKALEIEKPWDIFFAQEVTSQDTNSRIA